MVSCVLNSDDTAGGTPLRCRAQTQKGETTPVRRQYLSVEPSIHQRMVGAEGRAGHLPLELSGPATRVTGETAVGGASSTL